MAGRRTRRNSWQVFLHRRHQRSIAQIGLSQAHASPSPGSGFSLLRTGKSPDDIRHHSCANPAAPLSCNRTTLPEQGTGGSSAGAQCALGGARVGRGRPSTRCAVESMYRQSLCDSGSYTPTSPFPSIPSAAGTAASPTRRVGPELRYGWLSGGQQQYCGEVALVPGIKARPAPPMTGTPPAYRAGVIERLVRPRAQAHSIADRSIRADRLQHHTCRVRIVSDAQSAAPALVASHPRRPGCPGWQPYRRH